MVLLVVAMVIALEMCATETECGGELPACSVPLQSVPLVRQKVPAKARGPYRLFKSILYGHVTVGEDEYKVVFDTGSGHLIIPSVACTSPACLNHRRYNVSASETGQDIDYDGTPTVGAQRDQLTVSFGTGEISGVFVEEKVCLAGGDCIEPRIITATAMSDNPFLEFGFDGVLGLSLPGLSQTKEFNLGDQLTASGTGVFSVRLTGQPEITFGGFRPEYLAGPLSWVPVVAPEDGYWKLSVVSATVGGKPLELCEQSQCMAVADSGTSVFAGPSVAVNQIRETFAAGVTFTGGRCRFSQNATVEIVLDGGVELSLSPEDLTQPRLPENALPNATAEEGAACELMLMRLDVDAPLGPLFVLGEPFLAKYTTVFDVQRTRVGFGLSNRHALPEEYVTSAAF